MESKLGADLAGPGEQKASFYSSLGGFVRNKLHVEVEQLSWVEVVSKVQEGDAAIEAGVGTILMVFVLLCFAMLDVIKLLHLVSEDNKV